MKLCLVCSSGGHALELFSIKKAWEKHPRFWITFPSADTDAMLCGEKKYYAHHPTNRSIKNLVRNLFLAVKILRNEKPDIIISTGAGVAVPFILCGRWLKIKTVYIESLTRIKGLSLSGRLIYPFTDYFLVQWPELCRKYPKARYEGQVV